MECLPPKGMNIAQGKIRQFQAEGQRDKGMGEDRIWCTQGINVHFYIGKMNALVPSSCHKYMERRESQMNQISGFFHFPILVQMKLLNVSQKVSEMGYKI